METQGPLTGVTVENEVNGTKICLRISAMSLNSYLNSILSFKPEMTVRYISKQKLTVNSGGFSQSRRDQCESRGSGCLEAI